MEQYPLPRMRASFVSLPALFCLFAAGCTSGVAPNSSAPTAPASSGPAPVVAPGVVAWGDSLTQGNKGSFDVNNFPTQLGSLLTIPVVNEGISGNTSTQI